MGGDGVEVHNEDADPEEGGAVEESADHVDLENAGETGGDRGGDDDDEEVFADEEAMVEEGGEERSDRSGDVQRVVLPGLHADVVREERVDVGRRRGDQRAQNQEEHQREERPVGRHRVQAALPAENQLGALDDRVEERLRVIVGRGGHVLRHHAVLDLQRDDRCEEVGKTRHEEEAFVRNHRRSVFVRFLLVKKKHEEKNKHQQQRKNRRKHCAGGLRSHGQTLTATFIIRLLHNALHHQRVDHQLGSAFRRS